MTLNDIEVLPDGRAVLVLHDGALPRAMSANEVRLFAHNKAFGGLISDLKQIQKDDHADKAYLLNLAVRTVRAALEIL
jgi:hypothetical protein